MDYVDLQVNGAFGVDFNSDEMTTEQFAMACNKLKEEGVVGFLPTIITDSIPAMKARIERIALAVREVPSLKPLVRGIHVEGPFLSPEIGFYGTHPPEHIQTANIDDAMQLLDAGDGMVQLVTLAPEQDPRFEVTARLARENVLVFAGHSNASFETLREAIDNGLVGFTHLGNGCVHQVDRQDNIMQRVLALRDRLFVTLIADGIHLPVWLLQSWLAVFGEHKCIIVSDSTSAAGMPPGEYYLSGQRIFVEENRRTRHWKHQYLAGSASTLRDMDLVLQSVASCPDAVRRRILGANALELLDR
jgi:N-acetylglucosamine-6-phosphate deacetylase